MFFERSLIALVLCAGVAGCAVNPSPEATFVMPGTDTPIAASGPTWNMASVVGTTWWGEPISNVLTVEADAAATWWGEPISNLVAVAAIGQ
jgi:hypothetical protein